MDGKVAVPRRVYPITMYTTLAYDKRQSGRMTEVSCTADNSAGVMVDPTVPIRSDLDPDQSS